MKHLKYKCLLLLMAALCSIAARAVQIDGIYYNLYNYLNGQYINYAHVTYDRNNKYTGDIVIPSSVTFNGNTYTVMVIDSRAFQNCTELTSIKMPKTITKLGSNCFEGCTSLKSVTLSNALTLIEYHAFEGCTSLESISFPSSLKEIGYDAFKGCKKLKIAPLPSGLEKLGSSAFEGCSSLESVYIPKGITYYYYDTYRYCSNLKSIVVDSSNPNYDSRNNCNAIVEKATDIIIQGCNNTIIPDGIKGFYISCTFQEMKSLTKIHIPSSVENIPNGLFSGCSALNEITVDANNPNYDSRNNCNAIINSETNELIQGCNNTKIPEGVASIASYAFKDFDKLSSIEIPGSVIQLGHYIFQGCTSLKNVVLQSGLQTIGSNTFEGCTSLISIVLPNTLTSIGANAFSGTGLTSINFPNSLETISYSAFAGCTGLTRLIIPANVKSIGTSAFGGCYNLESITVDEGNEYYHSPNNCNAIIEKSTKTLLAGCNNTVMPDDIKSIGQAAFQGCNSITSLVIPAEVMSIGANAFANCANLTDVYIPGNVSTLYGSAFSGCPKLKLLVLPPSITVLCGFPTNSPQLKDIYLYAEQIPIIDSYLSMPIIDDLYSFFENTNATLHVLSSVIDTYLNNVWDEEQRARIVAITPEAADEGNLIYYYDKGTKTATLIGYDEEAEKMDFWQIPETVTHDGESYTVTAVNYSGYPELTAVSIPSTVRKIASSAFTKSNNLQKIIIPDVSTWCAIPFSSNNPLSKAGHLYTDYDTEIKDLVIPENVTSINQFTFYGGKGFTSLTIPEGVTNIGNYSFANCSGLSAVSIPNSLTSIGYYAFQNCTRLPVENGLRYAGSVLSEVTDKSYSHYTIKNGTRWILDLTFQNCSNMKSVTIPEGVAYIQGSVFQNCTSLSTVVLPRSLKKIGSSVFYGCTALRSIECKGDTSIFSGSTFFGVGTKESPVKLLVPEQYKDQYQALIDENGSIERGYFTIETVDNRTLAYAEYFVNTDSGLGKVRTVQLKVDEDGNTDFDIPASELRYGLNNIGIRLISTQEDGTVAFSPTVQRSVYRYHAEDAHTTGVEYRLNKDKWVFVSAESDEVSFDIDRGQLHDGINVLALRAVSENSETGTTRGTTHYQYIYRPAADGQRDIERIEYFWDEDPGKGNATPITFQTVNDSAIVNCDINYAGLYGPHVLCIRAQSHGIWSTLYQQAVILPACILSGDIVLDPDEEEDTDNGVFSMLSSLLSSLSTRGFDTGLNVNVADATYNFQVTEQSIAVIQALYQYFLNTNFYISMKAPKSATFNFVIPMEFLMAHSSELPQIVAAVQAMFSHIVTENISILINGQTYKYDGFQVEPNDLLALKNLYNRLGGENWTEKKWSFLSNGRNKDELPGVEFNDQGRVTSINLYHNNLKGVLSADWELNLPYLTYLNLSQNNIEGDLSPFLRYCSSLKSLYMSNNCLTEISDTLPGSLQTIDLKYQFKTGYSNSELKESYLEKQQPHRFYISNHQTLALPSLFTYNHKYMDHSSTPTVYLLDSTSNHNSFAYYTSQYGFAWKSGSEYTDVQDARYLAEISGGSLNINGSVIPMYVRYVEGDANMTGATDVLDVQHTLNRILGTASPFNRSAANTYADEVINVQDIVCTVNIVLNQQNTRARSLNRAQATDTQAWLYAADGQLRLASTVEVGAIDVELRGVNTSQVSLLLNHSRFQMIGRNTAEGSRYVIFSPTGEMIPAGEVTALLKLSTQAEVVAVQAANSLAEEMSITVGQEPTGIAQLMDGTLAARFQGNRLIVKANRQTEGLTLRLTSTGGAVVYSTVLTQPLRGETALTVNIAPGVYLLEMTTADGARKIVKLMKR